MLETDDFIIVHIPKCGGMTLRKHLQGRSIYGQHDGIYALDSEQRQKPIYALTREPREWYESLFRYAVDTHSPWLEEFGVPPALDARTFRQFLLRATVDPPEKHTLTINTITAQFDSFSFMRSRRNGFWSYWHTFLCSDSTEDLRIANDVKFVPCGHPRFYPPFKENTSTPLAITWDDEMTGWLQADAEVAKIVTSQMISSDAANPASLIP